MDPITHIDRAGMVERTDGVDVAGESDTVSASRNLLFSTRPGIAFLEILIVEAIGSHLHLAPSLVRLHDSWKKWQQGIAPGEIIECGRDDYDAIGSGFESFWHAPPSIPRSAHLFDNTGSTTNRGKKYPWRFTDSAPNRLRPISP